MSRTLVLIALIVHLLASIVEAQNFSGTYVLRTQDATITLTLNQDAQGNITGSLTGGTGVRYEVQGIVQAGAAVGSCSDRQGGVFFEARFHGDQLLFAMIEPCVNNMPDYSKARQLTFTRKEGVTPGQQEAQAFPGQQGGQFHGTVTGSPGMGSFSTLSGDEVSDPQWGFKFSLPKGWKVEKEPKGAILGHDTIPGVIWVFPHSASSFQEVQMQMQSGLDEDNVQLRLASQLQSLGNNAIAGIFSGVYQNQQVKARGIGTYSPNGGGAYIVAVTLPNTFGADLANAADAIAKSMRYFKAQASGGPGGIGGGMTSSGPGNQSLMRQMAGVYYSFSSAGLSYSGGTERRVTLCPDGTYYSGTESSYSAGAGTGDAWGAASQRSGRGTWRVQGNVNEGILTTIAPNGEATEYRYQRCGGDCIYFGNTKFAVAGPANCP